MLTKKILITGASGMLGRSLIKIFPDSDLLKGRTDLDLTDINKTNKWFTNKHYDVIIHCAAFTDINYCELRPKKARILHSEVVDHLCQHCDKLIYISTNPNYNKGIYYLTKYEGEKRTLLNGDSNVVLRTNIYGKGGLADWAITQLRDNKKISGFSNVMFNAIHVDQLSEQIREIVLDTFSSGVIEVAGNYVISKHEFICLIAKYLGLNGNLITKNTTVSQNMVIPCDRKISLTTGLELLRREYE